MIAVRVAADHCRLLYSLSTEVNIVMSHDLDTCSNSPASTATWHACRDRLLAAVLGKVFQHISIIPAE